MIKTVNLFLLMIIFLLTACAPLVTESPVSMPVTENALFVETQSPIAVFPTEVDQSETWKLYTNNIFGFSFQYATNWFGPSEYISENTLRVEVGSDTVYPYGEPPEQPSDVKNSYSVIIQYTKNDQNSYWKETYQRLQSLNDGESFSDTKSLIIRIKQLNIGKFSGFEYISTLSETAQTSHVYAREVILFDGQTNDLLIIRGQPNNVEVSNSTAWKDTYQTIDEANLIFFNKIIESILISN